MSYPLGIKPVEMAMNFLIKLFFLMTLTIAVSLSPDDANGKAKDKKEVTFLLSFPISESNINTSFTKQWKWGDPIPPGTYKTSILAKLKSSQYTAVGETLVLEPQVRNLTTKNSILKFGEGEGKNFPENLENPSYKINLFKYQLKESISIKDYDELQIDYQGSGPNDQTLIKLEMGITGEKIEGKTGKAIIEAKYNPLTLFNSEDIISTTWKKKNYVYLIKRLLKFEPDSSWHYIEKDKNVFFQKRFNLDLSKIETVDVVFKDDAKLVQINSLNCNFRVAFEPRFKRGKIIECRNFPKRLIKENGQTILRIRVGELIQSIFKKNRKPNLDEIIFFLPQTLFQNIDRQPVASINFQALTFPRKKIKTDSGGRKITGKKDVEPEYYFYLNTETIGPHQNRITFPIRKLVKKTGSNGKITSLGLSVRPPGNEHPGKFRINRLRLNSFKTMDRPILFNTVEKLIEKFGGPFLNLEENNEKIEWLHIHKFFPFQHPMLTNKLPIPLLTHNRKNNKNPLFNKPSDFIHFREIEIHSDEVVTGFIPDEEGLKLEGKGNWIELDWPVSAKLDNNTRFFIGIGEGSKHILDIKVQPIFQGKKLNPVFTSPNISVVLLTKNEQIDRLKIRISFREIGISMKLKEMALIQPLALSPTQAIDSPIIFKNETTLWPEFSAKNAPPKITYHKDHFSIPSNIEYGPQKNVTFTTSVKKKMKQIQGLIFNFKVPIKMNATYPCWLQFTLIGSENKIKHKICPESSTGKIVISPKELFQNINIQDDELIQNIIWNLYGSALKSNKELNPAMDFGITLFSNSLHSIREELSHHPLMVLNGKQRFSDSLDKISSDKILSTDFVVNLGSVLTEKNSEATLPLNLLDHPYLEIKSVIIERKEPLTSLEFDSLSDTPSINDSDIEAKHSLTFVPYIILFFLLLVIWIGVIKKKSFLSFQWLVKVSLEHLRKQVFVWVSIGAGLYLSAQISNMARWYQAEDLFLSLGGIAIVLTWRCIILAIRPVLESRCPNWANFIYSGRGTPYLAGFFLILPIAILFLLVKVTVVAEQVGVIGYYLLVIGVILEANTLRKKNLPQTKGSESTDNRGETRSA